MKISNRNLKIIVAQQLRWLNSFRETFRMISTRESFYKRKRQQRIIKIIELQNKAIALSEQLTQSRGIRSVWTKNRTCRFFENDAQLNGETFFKDNFRMSRECFDIICEKIKGMSRQDTTLRKCIPLDKRVAIALYALGSSAEYRTIANLFGVGKSTVCQILLEFCDEVWRVMRHEYMDSFPLQNNRIKNCVEGFNELGFPQCYGAIDGCHIEVSPNAEDAVDYHNYKGWYSVVLFACVDYRYRFQYISVGSPGRCNDSQIFETSNLKKELLSSDLNQYSKQLCGVDIPVLLIGDSAFRLSSMVMKPYSFRVDAPPKEKAFNYALSKARRVVENAFGHLKARFRRVGKGLDNRMDKVAQIIKCCCVLHNFLNENNDTVNQHWLQQLQEIENNNQKQQPEEVVTLTDTDPTAQSIRESIANYLIERSGPDDDDVDGRFSLYDPLASSESYPTVRLENDSSS